MKIFKEDKISTAPVFLLLLPLFFVLHGLSEYLFFIPLLNAMILLFKYLIVSILLFLLAWFFFKDVLKADLAVMLVLSVYFFFGAFHDFLKKITSLPFLSKYSVLLPLLFVLLFLCFKRIKRGISSKVAFYLNSLFFVLILLDAINIGHQILMHREEKTDFLPCPNCKKSDVYLLLLDGYAGQNQLGKDFSFSNKDFLNQLRQLHFYVLDSSFSNYSDTPFSMSSMLNMKYLGLKDYKYSDQNLNYCYEQIANNRVVRIFKKLGYKFVNNSIFDIQGQAAPINKTFLISGTQLITSQTLFGRLKKDVYNNLVAKYFRNSRQYKKIVFSDLRNNESIYNRTINVAKENAGIPRFVYSHLLMPHFPYYYNSVGQLNPLSALAASNLYNDSLYLQYLQYCDRYVSNLIVSILKHSQTLPVILLMSDHGFRKDNNYSCHSNLAAVYLPDGDYSGYRNNLSNINQFPVLFNKIFHQKITIVPDKIEE